MQVRLAGLSAGLGLALFVLGAGMLVLLGAGLSLALGLGVLPQGKNLGTLAGVVVLDGGAAYAAFALLRAFRTFSSISVGTDGAWRLKNGLGIPVGTLYRQQPRQVRMLRIEGTNYMGSVRRIHAARLVIEAGTAPAVRHYQSWTVLPETVEAAMEQLT